MSWVECACDKDYEINSEFPYNIRRKSNNKIIKESRRNDGYVECWLNCKRCYKHVAIAKTFIPNPDNLVEVNHINRIRDDNRIENLEWISKSDNTKNINSHINVKYHYKPKLINPINITQYSKHEFRNYYYDKDDKTFYYYNGHEYRNLTVITQKPYNIKYVHLTDINNYRVHACINKLKQIYDID